jgi:peptidyl-prolyl cis-trans isomerase D
VGASPDFDQSIATLKKGEVSQAVSPSANKLVVAEVTGIVPAHPATFEEVKSRIHDTMVTSKVRKTLQDKSKDLQDTTKANGGDLAKAAKSLGLEVKTTELFKQQATVEGLGQAGYFQDAFNKPVGTVLDPVSMSDATVVAKVVQHVDADMSQLAAQRDQIRDQLKSEKARQRSTIFETGLVDELTRKGVIKLYPEVLSRIVASFRGNS